MEEKHPLHHDSARREYWFEIEGHRALIAYDKLPDGSLALNPTLVPDALSGRGIGRKLVAATLEELRRLGRRIHPRCSFIRHYIERHPEWQTIVAE